MSEKELTFWDHLDELRRVLFRVLGVWFVLAIGYFIAMPYLFDNVILAPCHNDFIFYDLLRWIGQRLDLQDEFFTQEFHVKLVNINLAAPFFVHMSTAFWMSVVTAAPYIFYEIWRFVSPALYPNERKGVRKALGIGTVMFFIGVLLGYFMVYPLTLRFLSTYQLSAAIENQISLNSYIDNFMMLVLCMGLAFELPLVTWLLSLLGLVHKTFLRKYRRHAVVIIVIASAIITPTGALHGTGIRTAAGDMAAFPAGTGAQDLFAEIPPSCCCHHCYCLGHHYSDRCFAWDWHSNCRW